VSRDLGHVCKMRREKERKERKGEERGEKREREGGGGAKEEEKKPITKKRTLDDKGLVGLDVPVAEPERALPRVRREDARARDELEAVFCFFGSEREKRAREKK